MKEKVFDHCIGRCVASHGFATLKQLALSREHSLRSLKKKKNYPMARKKLLADLLRTKQINVRLTQKEYDQVIEFSKGSELSATNWIRKFIFSKRFPKAKMSPITMDTFNELNKIGVNLNQLTRLANSGRLTEDVSGILLVLNKQIVQIKLLLLNDSETNKG